MLNVPLKPGLVEWRGAVKMTPEPSVQSELTGKHLNTINECQQLRELMAGMSGVFYQYVLGADGGENILISWETSQIFMGFN